jgi:hypothetical protein
VIAVNGNITASLTLSGTSSDVFVINVTGTVTFPSLSRRVALKVLPFAAALDTRQLQRFRN